ncbi:MAG TPA: sigma 54-interacting transcriptional regulator [Thermoanaerobaculia bacterium]|nr:sigma 54-interacting transcriptional regulator [Thermoanaerobaculia bacterium]
MSTGIFHPCLASPARSLPLSEAWLTDRQRAGVLLQAAGLLSLLDRSGLHLAGWEGARIAAGGLLAVTEGDGPGRSPRPAQDLLLELTALLFGEGLVAGRGEARRAMRALLDDWGQSLVPIPADEIVAQILEAAPFLWRPDLGAARRALTGELGPERPWVAGPRAVRARLLARGLSSSALADLLAGPEARSSWSPEEEGTPGNLAAAGRWRAALAAWERKPPESGEERVERAAVLIALGRFEAALEELAGLPAPDARALCARCQLDLGQLGAAQATLRGLEAVALQPGQVVELAEIAARVEANRKKPGRSGFWLRRALKETADEPRTALGARLVAAGAAWDREDFNAMQRFLEEARAALDDPELAWRWHQLRALWVAEKPGGGPEVVESAVRALRASRRQRRRREAAGLWNDLGVARARAGDLPGAERAFLHLLRLEAGCDGPRKTTLALFNIAEIRVRRGKLAGVAESLARSQEANRRSGNLRGLAQDFELTARFELALGRPAAALALCAEARECERSRAEPDLIAARALGWLGRREEAAARLSQVPAVTLEELEPEERPAVRAHAADPGGALHAASGTPFARLWEELLGSGMPAAGSWEPLAILEPYRAARLVFDAEIAVPGSAPAYWLRTAAATLRRVGAVWPAEILEARDGGPWRLLAAYLRRTPGDPEGLAALLAGAGHPGAELSLLTPGELRLLIPGPGGPVELATDLEEGRLALRAAAEDDALRAVFALAIRDLSRREAPAATLAAPPPAGGLVGESPALQAALTRIARLAPGDLTVLIQGESGTGKELAARQLHRASRRSGGPFLAVNCAGLSETLVLSELFGHARGAFTGADRERKGVFETAHGGTVLLDEIGDLPLPVQGYLLRVLQEGEIRRVGESEPRRVNVRVLAATHRDLARMTEEGTFRSDLYFRLRGGSVELPPLRDRGDDVIRLAEHFLRRLRDDRSNRSERPASLSGAVRTSLLAHRWPGNVRELQNVMSLATTLAGEGSIEPEHLELPGSGGSPRGSYHRQIDDVRRRQVIDALGRYPNNFSEAARWLGISRQTLSYLMRRLGIDANGKCQAM